MSAPDFVYHVNCDCWSNQHHIRLLAFDNDLLYMDYRIVTKSLWQRIVTAYRYVLNRTHNWDFYEDMVLSRSEVDKFITQLQAWRALEHAPEADAKWPQPNNS